MQVVKLSKSDLTRTNIWLIVICLIAALVLQSRSFVVGYLGSLFVALTLEKNLKFSWQKAIIFSAVFLLVTIALIVFLKTDSSYGRLFIYKISWQMFRTNYLFGIGFGNFAKQYLLYQAAYFEAAQFTTKEFLIADNTYYAFNDYLQVLIEAGIVVGSLIIVAVIVSLFLLIKRFKYLFLNGLNLSAFLLLQLITLVIAATFTHIFYHATILISVAGTVCYLLNHQKALQNKLLRGAGVMAVITCLLFIKSLPQLTHRSDLIRAKKLAQYGYHAESLKLCNANYIFFNKDIEFLNLYADELIQGGMYSRALEVLQQEMQYRTNNLLYQKIAKVKIALSDAKSAEDYYKRCIAMVPNRFSTRFELFKFYLSLKQNSKAESLGRFMLHMPVKIPSSQVNTIKSSVSHYLTINKSTKYPTIL